LEKSFHLEGPLFGGSEQEKKVKSPKKPKSSPKSKVESPKIKTRRIALTNVETPLRSNAASPSRIKLDNLLTLLELMQSKKKQKSKPMVKMTRRARSLSPKPRPFSPSLSPNPRAFSPNLYPIESRLDQDVSRKGSIDGVGGVGEQSRVDPEGAGSPKKSRVNPDGVSTPKKNRVNQDGGSPTQQLDPPPKRSLSPTILEVLSPTVKHKGVEEVAGDLSYMADGEEELVVFRKRDRAPPVIKPPMVKPRVKPAWKDGRDVQQVDSIELSDQEARLNRIQRIHLMKIQ
jgi:hypothetical protein